MASSSESIVCDGFVFYNDFDSANLAKVERASDSFEKEGYENEGKSSKSSTSDDNSDYEFNLWTKHDCHGTRYQNNNRTWFYFGIKAIAPGILVKLNIVNLNKQVKMFSQGMCPVFRVLPGHSHWERIRERPTYNLDRKGTDFTLSFRYYTPENPKAITYFAFTYPFSYTDLQTYLRKVDAKMARRSISVADDVYYHRECAIRSLEGRRLELLTISSFYNISTEREDRLKNMFLEKGEERPFKFWDKKVVFVSARVHPGETPSSFVLNGFLDFLLNREDQIAVCLRRLYVFKLMPMLNPDGVARGHYRMDTKGINLNRVYLDPSEKEHPTIYAARTLIRYYHHSYKLPDEQAIDKPLCMNLEIAGDATSTVMDITLNDKSDALGMSGRDMSKTNADNNLHGGGEGLSMQGQKENALDERPDEEKIRSAIGVGRAPTNESGLFLYIDLHGHASKKGVFMYGNHFDDPEDTISCMLLPKLMSINNPHFHFTSCNFAERNMYLIDKRDGMSREGSGRVAIYKMTGLVRSYTLECNYNSGRLVNAIPARIRDGVNRTMNHMFVPPKYTPTVFEAVGAALGPSILDLTSSNPNSRLPNSQYRCLRGVKSYLKLTYANNFSGSFNKSAHKDDSGIIPKDTFSFKGFEGKESNENPRTSTRSETTFGKKSCVVRRSTSLYLTTKKSREATKETRQIRRSSKNARIDGIENDSSVCTIASFKTADRSRSRSSNLERRETATVEQAAKRFKVVPSRTSPEKIGELFEPGSNSSLSISNSSPKVLSNEQSLRRRSTKIKKHRIVHERSRRKISSLGSRERND